MFMLWKLQGSPYREWQSTLVLFCPKFSKAKEEEEFACGLICDDLVVVCVLICFYFCEKLLWGCLLPKHRRYLRRSLSLHISTIPAYFLGLIMA